MYIFIFILLVRHILYCLKKDKKEGWRKRKEKKEKERQGLKKRKNE